MLRFERATDPIEIKKIVAHPDVYPFVTDDFSPAPRNYWPPLSSVIYWLVAYQAGEVVGAFLFLPINAINFDFHAAVFPWARGTKWSRLAGAGALDWMWQNTKCLRVTASCPSFNLRALGWFKALGFKEFGVNHASFQKFEVLHDLIMLGVSKPPAKEE